LKFQPLTILTITENPKSVNNSCGIMHVDPT